MNSIVCWTLLTSASCGGPWSMAGGWEQSTQSDGSNRRPSARTQRPGCLAVSGRRPSSGRSEDKDPARAGHGAPTLGCPAPQRPPRALGGAPSLTPEAPVAHGKLLPTYPCSPFLAQSGDCSAQARPGEEGVEVCRGGARRGAGRGRKDCGRPL